MAWQVLPIEKRHIAGFHAVLDAVARERRYLAFLEAPPLTRVRRFVLTNLAAGGVQYVAVDEGRVIGWCDVTPQRHAALRHGGTLGMGVAAGQRGRGIGDELLRVTLAQAFANGLQRIDLVVRADNAPAIALYRRHGFEQEGLLRRYLLVDGMACDALQMSRLVPEAQAAPTRPPQ